MLSREENDLLTRTGPGTPMGEVLRRYWLPALLSAEIPEPDCPPVQVKLLSESLVAFRDTEGRIGLLDEFCAHRGTSLWLGRNEECGLRCVWHGWKYDVNGQCVDQMNQPGSSSFAYKIRIKSYPVLELGGVVWAYMGPENKMPAPPKFGWTQVPATHRHTSKLIQECNWLQGLEGGLDQIHVPILHKTFRAELADSGIAAQSFIGRTGMPVFEIEETDFGLRYVAIRRLAEDRYYVRGYNFIMPFTQVRHADNPTTDADLVKKFNTGHMWVPIDDENCMVWNWMYSWGDPLTEEERMERRTGNGPDEVDQRTFRPFRNRDNSWLIDREMQRRQNFSGITKVNAQDRAVQELQGRIVDRTKEHLGPADKVMISARQLLLRAAKTVAAGEIPMGADASYYCARGATKIIPADGSWQELMREVMYPAENKVAGAVSSIGRVA